MFFFRWARIKLQSSQLRWLDATKGKQFVQYNELYMSNTKDYNNKGNSKLNAKKWNTCFDLKYALTHLFSCRRFFSFRSFVRYLLFSSTFSIIVSFLLCRSSVTIEIYFIKIDKFQNRIVATWSRQVKKQC